MNGLPNPESVLQVLFAATWQSALLALIVFLLLQLTGRWIPATWRVVFWTIPLLRLVVLVLPATAFSLFQFVDRVAAPSPAASLAMPAQSGIAYRSLEPTSFVAPAHVAATSALPGVQMRPAFSLTRLAWLAIAVWLSGVAVLAARWLYRSICLRLVLMRHSNASASALQSLVDDARSHAKVVRPIRCFLTDADIGPATCGLLRPKILISKRLASELSDSDLRIVIAHEIEHIRRCDCLLLILGHVAVALHWFNPLAYFIRDTLQREIEMAVDASIIGKLGTNRAAEYGDLLLRIVGRANPSLGIVPMASGGTNVRRRIEHLMRWRRPRWCHSILAAAIACALALGGLTDNDPQPALAQNSAHREDAAAAVDSSPSPEAEQSSGITPSGDDRTEKATDANIRRASGRVIDASGNPVAGAQLFAKVGTAAEVTATVNNRGRFSIEYPTTRFGHDTFHTWVYAPGHGVRVVNMAAAFAVGAASDVEIQLPPVEPQTFTVHLPSGAPCVDAAVRPLYVDIPNGVLAADEPTGLSAYAPEKLKPLLARRTDGDGRVTIESIPAPLLDSLEVEIPGYGRQHFRKLDGPLRLAAVGEIRGRLQIASPESFAGTRVFVTTDEGESNGGIAETVLDEAGHFQIPAIADGRVNMYLLWEPISEVHPFVAARPTVRPGETLDLVIEARTTIAVTGRVVTSDTHQPVANALISHQYLDNATLRIPNQVITDTNGRYTTRLAAGVAIRRQIISGIPTPYEHPRLEPILIPSDAQDYAADDILIHPMRLVTGKLLDAKGDPVSSATVVLHTGSFRHVAGKAETNADGSFEMRVRNWDYFSNSGRARWYWATLDKPATDAAPPQFTRLQVLDANPDALLLQRGERGR